MKKILIFLASFSFLGASVSTTVACGTPTDQIVSEEVSYNVLSVGNGEFTYVKVGNKAVVLDAGRGRPGIVAAEPEPLVIAEKQWREAIIGWDFIKNEFDKNGIEEVEAVFISHAHEDHTWLLGTMVKNMPVNNIIMPATNYQLTADHFVNDYKFQGKIYTKFQDTYSFLGITFENLTNAIGYDQLYDLVDQNGNINNSSMVLRFNLFNQTILFTGDADREEAGWAEGALLKKIAEKPVNFYVLPHHGSDVSANELFLNIIGKDISYALISGTFATEEWKTYGGGFKFPRTDTIKFLKEKASQAEVYVTGVLPPKDFAANPDFYSQVKGKNSSYTFTIEKQSTKKSAHFYSNFSSSLSTIINVI